MIEHIAHLAADLLGEQVLMVGDDPAQRLGERGDRPSQLDHLALEQVDRLDGGFARRGERRLLNGVDVGFHRLGHGAVGVDDVVGDRMHHRVGAECELGGFGFQFLADSGQSGVVAVADGHHEVRPDEDHDLACLDDLAGQFHRLVRQVVHRLENQEQGVVVPLDLGPLMGVHRILHGQRMQSVRLGDRLHLVGIGLVQADPDERLLAGGLEVVHCVQGGAVGELSGQPKALGVHRAVHHGPRHRKIDRLGVCRRVGGRPLLDHVQRRGLSGRVVRHGSTSSFRAGGCRANATRWGLRGEG